MPKTIKKLRLAVLVSGGGTNLQAMIDRSMAGTMFAEIAVVLSDCADAYGLSRAEKAGIPSCCVDYKSYGAREITEEVLRELPVDLDELDGRQEILKGIDPLRRRARLARLVLAERELIEIIERHRVDYVCLAGFMRLVTPYFIGYFNAGGARRVLNIHPALLPSFPGMHGYEDTFEYGCKWGGITVHFVDEGEDTGPIIAQAVYPIWPDDDPEKVRARGLQLEYAIYPQVINWLARGQIRFEELPGRRPRVLVVDPEYPAVLRAWAEKALR
ncbi:MAG: phosphoribosylglycinamide formyltransferase [Syntrophobacteraceae bacterium]